LILARTHRARLSFADDPNVCAIAVESVAFVALLLIRYATQPWRGDPCFWAWAVWVDVRAPDPAYGFGGRFDGCAHELAYCNLGNLGLLATAPLLPMNVNTFQVYRCSRF
jgi:hypothetical protein